MGRNSDCRICSDLVHRQADLLYWHTESAAAVPVGPALRGDRCIALTAATGAGRARIGRTLLGQSPVRVTHTSSTQVANTPAHARTLKESTRESPTRAHIDSPITPAGSPIRLKMPSNYTTHETRTDPERIRGGQGHARHGAVARPVTVASRRASSPSPPRRRKARPSLGRPGCTRSKHAYASHGRECDRGCTAHLRWSRRSQRGGVVRASLPRPRRARCGTRPARLQLCAPLPPVPVTACSCDPSSARSHRPTPTPICIERCTGGPTRRRWHTCSTAEPRPPPSARTSSCRWCRASP